MTTVMIKPLRTYEDRGEIRKRNGKPYPAPAWLAKDLEQQGLCEVVDGKAAVEVLSLSIKHAGRGKWVVVDASGEQVGEFSGTKEEAAEELGRLVSEAGESESIEPSSEIEGGSESPVPPESVEKE